MSSCRELPFQFSTNQNKRLHDLKIRYTLINMFISIIPLRYKLFTESVSNHFLTIKMKPITRHQHYDNASPAMVEASYVPVDLDIIWRHVLHVVNFFANFSFPLNRNELSS